MFINGILTSEQMFIQNEAKTLCKIPRETNQTLFIWVYTENVRTVVKCFLVYVEIRDFSLTFQFIIAHWNVYPTSGEQP